MRKLILIFLLGCIGCGGIRVNGIQVKRTHRKVVTSRDIGVVVGIVAVGAFIGNSNNINKKP
jgi:hypothetical protein